MVVVRIVEYFGEPPGFCEWGNDPAECSGGSWTLLDRPLAAHIDRSTDGDCWSIICAAHLAKLRADPAAMEGIVDSGPRALVEVHPSTAAELGLKFGTSTVRWATIEAES